jgi:MYXO-CTERM domain-containing protein
MRHSKLIKAASIGILSLGLTALPFSISTSAQEAPDTDNSPAVTENADFDWGWLGLLGLLGLFGLAGKKRSENYDRSDEPALYRDPNVTSSTSYRDRL